MQENTQNSQKRLLISGLRHVSILKLVGTEVADMGGVLDLYPINGENPISETLAEKLHFWKIRLTYKHLKCV